MRPPTRYRAHLSVSTSSSWEAGEANVGVTREEGRTLVDFANTLADGAGDEVPELTDIGGG